MKEGEREAGTRGDRSAFMKGKLFALGIFNNFLSLGYIQAA